MEELAARDKPTVPQVDDGDIHDEVLRVMKMILRNYVALF
jgi:hypothetical protein